MGLLGRIFPQGLLRHLAQPLPAAAAHEAPPAVRPPPPSVLALRRSQGFSLPACCLEHCRLPCAS